MLHPIPDWSGSGVDAVRWLWSGGGVWMLSGGCGSGQVVGCSCDLSGRL